VLAAFAHPRYALKVHAGGGVSALAALPKSKLLRVYHAKTKASCFHITKKRQT